MLIRRAVLPDGRLTDIRVGERITAVAERLEPLGSEHVDDAGGGAVLPGLHDHHLHVRALAARAASVLCGPPDVSDAAALREALANPGVDGWVRGVGYHESVAGDLDRRTLDELAPDVPVRLQHRSGALWVLNTAALRAIGADDGDGRFFRADAWLRERVPPTPLDLDAVGRKLATYGITGVTEATPGLDTAGLETLLQHVVALGPSKIVLSDHELPGHDELADSVRRARELASTVAIHCVTAEAAALVIAVLEELGSVDGDRIEHGAVLPEWTLPRLAALDVTVVTQPGFIADRGDDYVRALPRDEHADVYRYASLRTAGVAVAPSSDTPFGPLDPWAIVTAARDRRSRSGAIVGESERVDATTALDGYLSRPESPGGSPRRVQPGAPADLCLLAVPLRAALAAPDSRNVARTIIAGTTVYAA